MQIDLTQGPITRTMLRFAVPMICGNLLQQLYNVVDTLIVGQYLGGSRLCVYTDDIPHLYFPWPLYGKRSCFCNPLW